MMEGIFLGQAISGVFATYETTLAFKHERDIPERHSNIRYSDCDYVLVTADDVIKTNDELLRLRDEVKQWDAECNDWKVRYSKVNNELFQKGLAYGILENAYNNEKIAGEMLIKERDAFKERVEKLEAELTEIKTARTLREAYISGVEKGCEGLREERDRWKSRWNSVVTDIGESLKANGITFVLKEIHGDGNWDVVIDIPELTEAKKKVEDLEKKLAAAKSNETFWRDRKEEEEEYHHYWLHTYDRVVKQAADKGIHIDIRCTDETCNAGVVVVDNVKAEELEKRVSTLEKFNKNLNQKIGAADNALEYWNNTYNDIVIAGKNVGVKIDIKGKKSDTNAGFVHVTNEKAEELQKRGDYWKGQYDDLAEYWDNTYKEIVYIGEKVGVKIEFEGDMPYSNTGKVHVTNDKALGLAYELNNIKQKHDKKWSAMNDALKAKGVEVIYMGEEDEKPIVDVKVPALEDLKKDHDDLNVDYINRGSRIECLNLDLRDNKAEVDKYKKLFKHSCDMKDYWYNTYYEAVRQSWSQGVSIRIDESNLKDNVGIVQVNNKRAEDLKKELEDLKSKKVATCTLEADANGRLKFIYTYMDGHNESAPINGAIDAESISHGTIPKCSSCARYMHNPSRWAHDWCYKPVSKEGPGTIRKLNKEEAEGPACADFKARKE